MAHRPRSGPLMLSALFAVLFVAEVALQASHLFAGPLAPAVPRHGAALTSMRAEADAEEVDMEETELDEEEEAKFTWIHEIPDRGIDLDGDKLDNLDEWYEETISGKGGMPTNFMKDLVLRSFFGTFNSKGFLVPSRAFTGANGEPSATDYEAAYETMKTNVKEGKHFLGENDGKGWIWLVAGQTPGGLYLYMTKSPPYGERPLALIRENDIDEFFAKVDWHRLFVRLHKWNLWGGKAKVFPYPIRGKLGFTTR